VEKLLDKKIESRDTYHKMLTRAVQDRKMPLENVRSMRKTIQSRPDGADVNQVNSRLIQFQTQLKIVLKRCRFEMKIFQELPVDMKADLRQIEQLYTDLERFQS
jgi:hypothetical protein